MFVIAMARLFQVVPAQLMQQSSLNEPIKCFYNCRAQLSSAILDLLTDHSRELFALLLFYYTLHFARHNSDFMCCKL